MIQPHPPVSPFVIALRSSCETSTLLLALWMVFPFGLKEFFLYTAFFLIWKGGTTTLHRWAQLEQWHRIVEEEQFHIQHDRKTVQEELVRIYQAKGFKGNLLEEVVATLMTHDAHVLPIMIEEKRSIPLQPHPHPLEQGLGASIGVFCATVVFLVGIISWKWGPIFAAATTLTLSTGILAKNRKAPLLDSLLWILAVAAFSLSAIYFFR